MDNIYYEKVLNRIIQGRLRIKLGDLVLFVYEPSADIIEESFDIYEDMRKMAYFSGVMTKGEVIELLVENDLWTPLDDKEADKIEKSIEDLKVEAYNSFLDKKVLRSIKRRIKSLESALYKTRFKKVQFDHVTCEGVANFTRSAWIIEHSTKTADGEPYGFGEVSVQTVMEKYNSSVIPQKAFRAVSRSGTFRSMWNASKKRSDVFGICSTMLDQNQLSLISYSQMYDSVYESPDSPSDKIIEDDICLDGWLISERRKREQQQKESQVNDQIKNEKIANSQEVFIMAKNKEHAEDIYSINSDRGRQIIKGRQEQLANEKGGLVKVGELSDVKQGLQMDAVNAARDAIKRR